MTAGHDHSGCRHGCEANFDTTDAKIRAANLPSAMIVEV